MSLGSWQWEEAEMSMRSPFPKETSAGVVTCLIEFLSQFSPFARTFVSLVWIDQLDSFKLGKEGQHPILAHQIPNVTSLN